MLIYVEDSEHNMYIVLTAIKMAYTFVFLLLLAKTASNQIDGLTECLSVRQTNRKLFACISAMARNCMS